MNKELSKKLEQLSMEQLKSILTDLDNKEITKHQAYELISILTKTEIKDEFDYLTPGELNKVDPEWGNKYLVRSSDNFPICECFSEKESKAVCNALNKDSKNILNSMID